MVDDDKVILAMGYYYFALPTHCCAELVEILNQATEVNKTYNSSNKVTWEIATEPVDITFVLGQKIGPSHGN